MAAPASGIIRTVKDRDHPYKTMNTAVFFDTRLSLEARGLLGYLLSKPDDWQVRFNDLLKNAVGPGCKEDRLRRILKELEQAGYLVRERVRGEFGRMDWQSTIYETPRELTTIPEKPAYGKKRGRKPKNPHADKSGMAPYAGSPDMDNRHIYNLNESNNSSLLHKEEREPRAKRATPPPKQVNMNSFAEAVQVYKQLSGVKTIQPFLIDKIVDTVTDVPAWKAAIEAWIGAGLKPGNVNGMLDWYLDPSRQKRPGAANGYSKEAVPPTVAAARQREQPSGPAPSLREKLEARQKAHEGK